MSVRSSASLKLNSLRKCDVTAAAESNFAGQLVKRLGTASYLIDAATGVQIRPQQLPWLIAAYGTALRSAGLREGDRVLIGCSLSLSSALVYLGAMYAGLVAVPVEDRAVRDSAATLMEATGAKAIWTEAGLGESGAPKGFSRILQGDLWREAAGENPPAAREASDVAALMA